MTVYHGTAVDFPSVDLAKSRDRRDFGRGFYTTTIFDQAASWAKNVLTRYGGAGQFVKVYEFEALDGLKVKRFEGMTREWLDFVKENRVKGGVQHEYDIVIGPVANDNTMRTIMFYISGVYTAEMALEQLRFFKVNDQVSFHTARALSCIKSIRTEVLNG